MNRAQRRKEMRKEIQDDHKTIKEFVQFAPALNAELYKLVNNHVARRQDKLVKIQDLYEKQKEIAVGLAVKTTLKTLIGLTLLTLNSDFGFGEKRLNHYLARIFEQYECFGEGHLSIKDIEEWCREKKINFDELFKEADNE